MKKYSIIIVFFFTCFLNAQGFLRTHNQEIVNDNGAVLLRGIGTGNWLLQEGYMMQSTSAGVNTHSQFRNKLVASMGKEKTDAFYSAWIKNHFTKKDLDFMKESGFNSVRVALHYKWFTLPIEEETKNTDGSLSNTWLNEGFEIIDELLSWCAQNEMYLILDMHGAPGGQGKDANISDYDPAKPSLWESEENKMKLELLWVKLAERYKNSEWIGGFDLFNEPNWGFDSCENKNGCGCTNNTAIWDLHTRLIKAVRTVNTNHIVYVSGNCWGNNYEGFDAHALKNMDTNMVITFHKYWNYNTIDTIEGVLKMRSKYNLPLWMSEAGENSNTWFADCISLFEENNIGWSWWPVKKHRTNNILKIATSKKYTSLLKAWEKNEVLSAEKTFEAVMEYSDNHKFENCTVGKDVIFAMIEQPGNTHTKPFKTHTSKSEILFADYDLGNNGYAYFDEVSADYHISDGGDWSAWNEGRFYRNDGVDIGNDNGTPYVGWTEKDEWMQYTVEVLEQGSYEFQIEYASKLNDGLLRIEINGVKTESPLVLSKTNEENNWVKVNSKKVNLPKGNVKIRIQIEKGGFNLHSFKLKRNKR